MSKLEFNENDNIITTRPKKTKTSKTFASRLVSSGIVKTEQQANYLFIGVIVIGFIFIIYINMQTFSSPPVTDTQVPDQELFLE